VNISEQGRYQVNEAVLGDVGVEGIVRALQVAAGSQKDPVVVISADGRATHQSVVRVMDASRRAGYPRVTFVTQSGASP